MLAAGRPPMLTVEAVTEGLYKRERMEQATAYAVPAPNLNRLAVSATTHCLTGCVIGEVTGMVIATALGWGDVASVALAVGLAYLFGFTLTAVPLARAGLAGGTVVSTA